jgi:hypothetical protein
VVTGNTTRIVQAVIRAIVAGMLATVGAGLLLAVGGALSDLGRIALDASGAGVDAPLVPLQEVLMDTAEQREAGAELFIAFLAGLVIVFTSLAIYFILAMRPVLLAAVIVFLPVAHALSVWTPMRRVELRTWALAFAVLLADAAILTMFAVTNTVIGQPEGVDRLIFGTFGLLLAALAPAALARIIGLPELQTAVQSMTRGSRVVAAGAGDHGRQGRAARRRDRAGHRERIGGSCRCCGHGGLCAGWPRGWKPRRGRNWGSTGWWIPGRWRSSDRRRWRWQRWWPDGWTDTGRRFVGRRSIVGGPAGACCARGLDRRWFAGGLELRRWCRREHRVRVAGGGTVPAGRASWRRR